VRRGEEEEESANWGRKGKGGGVRERGEKEEKKGMGG